MYTTNLRVSNYGELEYNVEINASWITITDATTGKVVYKREPGMETWYDESHRDLVMVLLRLENAVFSAVEKEAAK